MSQQGPFADTILRIVEIGQSLNYKNVLQSLYYLLNSYPVIGKLFPTSLSCSRLRNRSPVEGLPTLTKKYPLKGMVKCTVCLKARGPRRIRDPNETPSQLKSYCLNHVSV